MYLCVQIIFMTSHCSQRPKYLWQLFLSRSILHPFHPVLYPKRLTCMGSINGLLLISGFCLDLTNRSKGQRDTGRRPERETKSKIWIFILYSFNPLPSGSACSLCPSKKVTSPFSWSCLPRSLQVLVWFHHFPPQIMVPPYY